MGENYRNILERFFKPKNSKNQGEGLVARKEVGEGVSVQAVCTGRFFSTSILGLPGRKVEGGCNWKGTLLLPDAGLLSERKKMARTEAIAHEDETLVPYDDPLGFSATDSGGYIHHHIKTEIARLRG